MAVTSTAISCGVIQLYKLSNYYNIERLDANKKETITTEDLVSEVQNSVTMFLNSKEHPFVIFSDSIFNSKAGMALAEYVIKNNLGEITVSPERKNPGHNTTIKVWIWAVDWENLRKWRR